MTIDATSATSGPLSVTEAIAQLQATPVAPTEPAAPAPGAPGSELAVEPEHEPEAEPTAEDALAPEAPAGEEPEQPLEPEIPAVEPPHYWDAAAKARFAELSPELQAVTLEQWKNGERVVNKAQEEAATARKGADEARQKAEAEFTSAADLNRRLGEIVPKAEETFKSRWDGVDWVALSKADPDQYVQAKAMFDAEQADLQRLQVARQDADKVENEKRTQARTELVKAEAEKLKTLAPDLADPKQGPARMRELVDFLTGAGLSTQQLANASALELALAYDAMKHRKALAAAASAARPKTPPIPARPAARPAAGGGTPQKTAPAAAMDRLRQSGSRDDAMAVLKARRQAH